MVEMAVPMDIQRSSRDQAAAEPMAGLLVQSVVHQQVAMAEKISQALAQESAQPEQAAMDRMAAEVRVLERRGTLVMVDVERILTRSTVLAVVVAARHHMPRRYQEMAHAVAVADQPRLDHH